MLRTQESLVLCVPVDVPEILELMQFYRDHAAGRVKYPPNEAWCLEHLGRDFFPVAAWHTGHPDGPVMVGALWIAKRTERISFRLGADEDRLFLEKSGPYTEVGGMLIHPDWLGREINSVLCATAWALCFAWGTKRRILSTDNALWVRLPGVRNPSTHTPLFWELIGGERTGMTYAELSSPPFLERDSEIFNRWRGERSIPLTPTLSEILGRPAHELVAYQTFFPQWGLSKDSSYSPSSLNVWQTVRLGDTRVPPKVSTRLGFFLDAPSR